MQKKMKDKEEKTMVDQTLPEIAEVQSENKARKKAKR